MKYREGELEFDFTAAKSVDKLDDTKRKLPEGMQFVDFVVEDDARLLLIEVKDPSCSAKGGTPQAEAAIAKSRADFTKKIENDSLISQELTPKARDSYTYLHLMKKDSRPMLYAFLLGADKLTLDPALLIGFKDRLLARIRHEADQPWSRNYLADCIVLTESNWTSIFPQYPVVRVSAKSTP
ncbi:MAG TPA: hypothetical protein HPP94_03830 [Desulfuromonadales bacterium]|nr:hypothetical protein [Desulfuromonadales bacterium]